MNKFIESDIENGIKSIKCGIMNALDALERKEVSKIELPEYVPFSLVRACALERGWKDLLGDDEDCYSTNGWELDLWYYLLTPNNERVCIYTSIILKSKTIIQYEED